MKTTTLRSFANSSLAVHPATAWYLSDLGEFRGKQELYTRQSPQRLKALREHALIESAVSSNRIEGVSVEPSRMRDLMVSPRPLFRDRDEEEVRGYRDALAWIHQDVGSITVSEATILHLHAMTRGEIWDAGKYKDKDGDIIERNADGGKRVRFRTVPAADTSKAMAQLVRDWQACRDERWVPPLIALAAFNLERLVEQSKDRYYETLEQSSQGWHEGRHDPWPYINYVLSILKSAYREFAERVGEVKVPRGAKRDQVLAGIDRLAARSGGFTMSELEQTCPGVSRDMVRRVLREQQSAGAVECQGRGPGATWVRKGVITLK